MGFITGKQISEEHVKRLAKLSKQKLWPSRQAPFFPSDIDEDRFPTDLTVLMENVNEPELKELLSWPIMRFIDANALDESVVDFIQHTEKNKMNKSFGMLLTCPTLYACDVARIFMDVIYERVSLSKSRYENIHLALHEAMVNGLIHGNLQISSNLRQSARDFIEYARLLDERLNDPDYAQKSMSLWATWDEHKLEIKIRDEGAGYAVMPVMRARPSVRSKSGRGLKMIAGTADSCTIDDFGREITLSFLLNEREHYQLLVSTDEEPKETILNGQTTDLSGCRVLVIEDNLSNQAVLGRLLNVIGITNIDAAADGLEGLHKVLEYKPDLIILDITMPRMNGYEVLHHLKSAPETKDIPVLIQTASDTRETREKTFSAGATDFISKPINPLEFFARVKVHLENRLLVNHLETQLKHIEAELNAAQRMQVGMLPSGDCLSSIRDTYHLDMAQHFEPSSILGGDFWQVVPISKKKLGLYICDFSGHGVAAALNTFRLQAIVSQMNRVIKSPATFLRQLNTRLYRLLPRGQFATFFFGIIDVEEGVLRYASAGSPAPILKTARGIKRLSTAGMPLGIMKTPHYQDHAVRLHENDRLFLFSDALTETPNAEGVRLGEDGFANMVRPHMTAVTAHVALDGIMSDFFRYAPPPPPDDVTGVFIRWEKKR